MESLPESVLVFVQSLFCLVVLQGVGFVLQFKFRTRWEILQIVMQIVSTWKKLTTNRNLASGCEASNRKAKPTCSEL